MENKFIDSIRLNQYPPKDSYIAHLPAVKNLYKKGELTFESPITFIVGENGSGKSTLLEAIAVAFGFNPEGGTRNFSFSTYDSHSSLSDYMTIIRSAYPKDSFFLRAESFYNVASNIEEMDKLPGTGRLIDSYGGVSLHEQSHGESFLSVIQNRFFGNGLYILDEPEAALSPTGIMSMMITMNELLKKNSQFIISTHSPILMTFPNSVIYELARDEIKNVTYKETEHYIVTKQFLDCPEKMYHRIFDEDL